MATQEKGKATWGVILGLIGGVLGVIAGFAAMLFGGAGMLFDFQQGAEVIGLGAAAIVLGLLGVGGGALTASKPTAATVMMTIAGVGGFVAVSLFWILPGVLLLLGAVAAIKSASPSGRRVAA